MFDNWIHEPAYLAGMIAGKLTKSNTVGVVAAMPIPEVNRLSNAFCEGAKEVNRGDQVQVLVHRLVLRSAQGQGGRDRADREPAST